MDLHFDVVGADGPKRYFNSLNRASLAHTYLFSGPPGVGKKTFARRLAQSLLCLAPKDAVLGYDGTCASCLLFRGDAHHPDFLVHEGTLKIGDSDAARGFYQDEELTARDLVRQLSLQSYSGGLRVLLLGDVDFSGTHAAANALLKFLEEPPSGVLILLTTPAPARLLPTIRSRAIEVRFPLLSAAQVREVLDKLNFGKKEAELGAALSGGSVTRALAALGGEEESLRAQVARWFFESVEGKPAQESWATRDSLDDGIETIKTLVRDWIVASGTDGIALVSLDHEARLRKLRPLEGREAATLLARLDEAQRLAQTNVAPAHVAELVRMALPVSW
jgi:DNA polymerase III subunit delta'